MFMALVAVTDVLSTRIGHATLVTGEIEQYNIVLLLPLKILFPGNFSFAESRSGRVFSSSPP